MSHHKFDGLLQTLCCKTAAIRIASEMCVDAEIMCLWKSIAFTMSHRTRYDGIFVIFGGVQRC